MVVRKEQAHTASAVKYNFNRKAGKSIIDRRPIFSPDGEFVLIIVQNVVRVYNIQTGDCSRVLETEESINELVSIQFPENDAYNLYGCSNTGLLTVWTWENGAVLREMQIKLPVNAKVLTFDLIDSNECFITSTKKAKYLHLGSYSNKTGEINYEYKSLSITYFGIIGVSVGLCDGDKYAAICNGSKCLYIQNLIQPHLRAEILNHNQLRILSVACHPVESCVAITDTLGRVTAIRGYLYNHNNLSKEVMHWHYLPPMASCFPMEGSYLLSGGMEKVLVKWTFANLAHKKEEKQFIPRLPGMVRYINCNNSHIALSLTNNCVVIATSQLQVVGTILECGGMSPAARALGTSLVYHRPLGALLLGGRTGHLQLYSTTTNKVLYNIDVTQMNSIPPTRENLLPLDMEVTCAAVSANGSWLVTSEYRNDGVTYPEERLKFWLMQEKGSTPFTLNTCVNLSHGGCQIVSIALNNNGDVCVSAGADQKFRIWKRESNLEGSKKTIYWKCLTACYYSSGVAQSLAHGILNDFKNYSYSSDNEEAHTYMTEFKKGDIIRRLININKDNSLVAKKSLNLGMKSNDESDMGGVAISQDGSLIAAWFGCKLTLWDSHACNLRTTLSHPAMRPKGLQVQFGNDDAAHYLVCTTEQSLAVWSLLSLTMKWLVNIKPTCLTADPFSNRIAVVTTSNDVIVFTPHSSEPLLRRERLINARTGVFQQCAFEAASGDHVTLYLMRNDSEIYCLEPEHSDSSRLEVVSRRNMPASNFSSLLAEQQLTDVKSARPAELEHLDTDGLGKTAISQFLSAAPHMMPPVSLLCTSFLEHISGSAGPKAEVDDVTEVMEVDDGSSDEDEPAVKDSGYEPKRIELWTPNYEAIKEKRLKKILKAPLLESDMALALFGT